MREIAAASLEQVALELVTSAPETVPGAPHVPPFLVKTALTFVAGIAFKSEGGVGLVAILGFPIIMPLLITIVRHSTAALEGASTTANGLNLMVLLVLNVVSFVLSYVLFPYLWRE
jgi:heme exporter protein B